MIRAIIVSFFAFGVQLFLAAFSLNFGIQSQISILPAAIILVTNEFLPHEALISLLIIGLFMDSWLGAPIGVVMLVLSILFILATVSINWIGNLNLWVRIAFIFLFSLAFRLIITLALGIAGGSTGNWDGFQFLIMPFVDAAIGTLFYEVNMLVLPFLGLSEIREDASQRLSRRSPRISLK